MPKRILIIDDEPDVLEIVRSVLNTKGHQVETAKSGEDGLALAREEKPDLIVCDLMMPRISGLEVIKRLKKDPELRSVPIIVLSALGDDEERTPDFWIQSLGIDDYVRKPFDPLDLLGRVEYIFRRSGYVSGGAGPKAPGQAPAASTRHEGPHPDNETNVPVDLRDAEPSEVVKSFIESWNRQDFATEFHCMSEEMIGQINLHDYVNLRRQTYLEEKAQQRRQYLRKLIEEKISVNVAKVVVEREDVANGESCVRQETYTLKKTYRGWKIIMCRSARK